MRGDMVVALPEATSQGHTLFGHNLHHTQPVELLTVLEPGRTFPPGEEVQTSSLTVPQVRQTFAVCGGRLPGMWGYAHGVNDRGLAVGNTPVRTRLSDEPPNLSGPDLVRLTLERAEGARQAVDVLAELIGKHGQGDEGIGNAFLLADGREAFLVEACGRYWVVQAVRRVRAVSDFCYVHQDWDRIARGLADEAIARGWWPGDGSKLNFTEAFGLAEDAEAGLPRWGRATVLLEQHNGHADRTFLRRLLREHGPSTRRAALCQHAPPSTGRGQGPRRNGVDRVAHPTTRASVIAELPSGHEELPLVWVALGPPCQSVYFPLALVGDLPRALSTGSGSVLSRLGELWEATPDLEGLRNALTQLQERLDQDTEEFRAEAKRLVMAGSRAELHALAGSFMQHAVERFEDACAVPLEAGTRQGG